MLDSHQLLSVGYVSCNLERNKQKEVISGCVGVCMCNTQNLNSFVHNITRRKTLERPHMLSSIPTHPSRQAFPWGGGGRKAQFCISYICVSLGGGGLKFPFPVPGITLWFSPNITTSTFSSLFSLYFLCY